eukprot:8031162-Pyramimonas_sp.AAC.1
MVAPAIAGGDIDVDAPAAVVWPEYICGQKVARETHMGAGGESGGFRIRCPVHANCRKFKAYGTGVAQYGPLAPIYWLGAWATAAPDMPLERHR